MVIVSPVLILIPVLLIWNAHSESVEDHIIYNEQTIWRNINRPLGMADNRHKGKSMEELRIEIKKRRRTAARG